MAFGGGTFDSVLRWERGATRLDELLEFAPHDEEPARIVYWFVKLAAWLRSGPQHPETKLRFFESQLASHPEFREPVSRAITRLVESVDVQQLLAYGGIAHRFDLLGALSDSIAARLLPRACATSDGAEILRLAFDEADATTLLRGRLAVTLRDLVDPDVLERLGRDVDLAMVDLAHQIIAQAHAPSVRALARKERSPFAGLVDAVRLACERAPSADAALKGRLRECRAAIDEHRAELVERGADLATTFALARITEQLRRLELLADLVRAPRDERTARCVAEGIVRACVARDRTRFFARSANLLVQNLVDATASVGRSYLDPARSAVTQAFAAGAFGGMLLAVATITKLLLAGLELPLFYESLAFSLNYAAAFCAAYLLHWTIATKLPAHTAAALARSVQTRRSHRARVTTFVDVLRATVRLQLAGLLGNVVVAVPAAALVDLGFARAFGRHVLSSEKAAKVVEAHSILGPSVLYAALTGAFLWLSSLIGAAGDNWARVSRLEERLATNVTTIRRLGPYHAWPFARVIVRHVGGIAGNGALGFLLGATPAIFASLLLPIEIRHVTVSASSIALALGAGPRADASLAFAGLAAIGAVNVSVAFVLALGFALRATRSAGVSRVSRALVRVGLRRWAFGKRGRPIASGEG